MLDFIVQQPIIAALVALAGLGILFGALLGFAAEKFKIEGDPVIDLIHELVQEAETKSVAYIREAECIGCTKCIQACPVDAILGAAKLMHTVIVDECTGCDLCVEPCPVDCIDMLPVETGIKQWQWPTPPLPNGLIATDKNSVGPNHEDAA